MSDTVVIPETIKIENWTDIRELVLMCIGTNKGTWWADPSFGSDLWIIRQEGKVNERTAGMVQQLVLNATQWLVDDGLAVSITCDAEREGKSTIGYTLTVIKPDGETIEIKEAWNAV